jgi:hypothetical protein
VNFWFKPKTLVMEINFCNQRKVEADGMSSGSWSRSRIEEREPDEAWCPSCLNKKSILRLEKGKKSPSKF